MTVCTLPTRDSRPWLGSDKALGAPRSGLCRVRLLGATHRQTVLLWLPTECWLQGTSAARGREAMLLPQGHFLVWLQGILWGLPVPWPSPQGEHQAEGSSPQAPRRWCTLSVQFLFLVWWEQRCTRGDQHCSSVPGKSEPLNGYGAQVQLKLPSTSRDPSAHAVWGLGVDTMLVTPTRYWIISLCNLETQIPP